VRHVHFRKFVSEKMLKKILELSSVRSISLSKYCCNRSNSKLLDRLRKRGIKIFVRKCPGRPSNLERFIVFREKNKW
jgi:hypothetical protein